MSIDCNAIITVDHSIARVMQREVSSAAQFQTDCTRESCKFHDVLEDVVVHMW